MIDFAHATYEGYKDRIHYDGVDESYLIGLDSLIEIGRTVKEVWLETVVWVWFCVSGGLCRGGIYMTSYWSTEGVRVKHMAVLTYYAKLYGYFPRN